MFRITINYIHSYVQNEDEMYHFFTVRGNASIIISVLLDDSGVHKWPTWNQEQNQWNELWSVPRDRCDLYGHCGANSKCDSNILSKFECDCLPGYEPKSPKD